MALLPNKILLLSVNAETYYKLGIIGEKSTLNTKKNLVEKYRITLELGKDYFKPNKKNYQRVLECLKRTQMKCDFVIKWNPNEPNISPNSLSRYFEHVKENCQDDQLLSKMTIHKCYPTLRTFTNYSTTNVPNICQGPSEHLEQNVQQFIEWISAQVAEVKLDYSDFADYCDIYCVEMQGFFTSCNLQKLLNRLKTYFSAEELGAIVVHGLEDSPQCWSGRNNQHYKDVSGESVFGIGQSKDNVISWCITDQYDFGIEKL